MTNLFLLDTDCLAVEKLFCGVYSAMPSDRKKKVDAFRFEKDKRLSLGAGVLLDLLLRGQGLNPAVPLSYGEYGKPFLEGCGVCFNLSHSGHFAVCAWGKSTVGVDIEMLSGPKPALVGYVCTEAEKACLKGLGHREAGREFTRMWTAKESCMKALGTGLAMSPKCLNVILEPELGVEGPFEEKLFFCEYGLEGYSLTACAKEPGFAPLRQITEEELYRAYGK